MKKKLVWLVIIPALTLLFSYMVNCCLRINYRSTEIITSNDGAFDLVGVNGNYGFIEAYLVIDRNSVLYATKSLFDGRYEVEGSWANKTNDFFVVSSGSGIYYYKFYNDNWTEYLLWWNEDENGDLTYVVAPSDGWGGVLTNFDAAEIPETVRSHIEKVRKRNPKS